MCKCKKSKEIRDRAESEFRSMTEEEALEALADDLKVDIETLRDLFWDGKPHSRKHN